MTERGTGRTSRQMMEAPLGATFFWCNDQAACARDLAFAVNRQDLKIQPASNFRTYRLRGLNPFMLVVDHYMLPFARSQGDRIKEEVSAAWDFWTEEKVRLQSSAPASAPIPPPAGPHVRRYWCNSSLTGTEPGKLMDRLKEGYRYVFDQNNWPITRRAGTCMDGSPQKQFLLEIEEGVARQLNPETLGPYWQTFDSSTWTGRSA